MFVWTDGNAAYERYVVVLLVLFRLVSIHGKAAEAAGIFSVFDRQKHRRTYCRYRADRPTYEIGKNTNFPTLQQDELRERSFVCVL